MIENLFAGKSVVKIFGTAGAGKTTKLIDIVEGLLNDGVAPEKIIFASFTKKAVDEMIDRCLLKFSNLNEKQFCFFKTIHALCYASSGIKKIMGYKELSAVAKSFGLEISYQINPEDCGGDKKGDKVVTIESLSRLRMVSLEQQWRDCKFNDVSLYLVSEFKQSLDNFKREQGFIDFTDLLENYNGSAIDAEYIIIDEAQDLSPLQWFVLDKMAAKCKKIYIAGDDDQLIYKWAGADVNYILNIRNEEEIILSQSHRLPANIYRLSREILKKIRNRKPKESDPIKKDGKIIKLANIDQVKFNPEEDYLILIRNKFLGYPITQHLESIGIPYIGFDKSSIDGDEIKAIFIWEKSRKNKSVANYDYGKCQKFSSYLKEFDSTKIPEKMFNYPWYEVFNLMAQNKVRYFRQMLAQGFKLNKKPNIKISTIHQAKGGECQNVILLTDVSPNTWDSINSDDEHRVWYVAVTRAKENLIIIQPQSRRFYKL